MPPKAMNTIPPNMSAENQSVGQDVAGQVMPEIPMDPAMLEDLQSQIHGAERQNQSDEIDFQLGKKQIEDLRRALLSDLFETLRANGVDPNDPNSVREFTESLSAEDPDFAQLFDFALNVLAPAVSPLDGTMPVQEQGKIGMPEGPGAGMEEMMGAIERGNARPEAGGPEEEMET